MITDAERRVLEEIIKNPIAGQGEIASSLGISRSAVASHISSLMKKGVLKRGYIVNEEPSVVVVGGANFDIKGVSFSEVIPMTSNPGKITFSPGGVGRNIAENLARLGIKTRLITLVGDDMYGDMLLKEAEKAGIDISGCDSISHRSSGTYMAIDGPDGNMVLALSDMEIFKEMTPEFVRTRQKALESASVIVADTNIPIDTIVYLKSQAAALYTPFCIEPVSVPKAALLKGHLDGVYMITPNKEEAEVLAMMDIKSDKDVEKAAVSIASQGVSVVVITLGQKGVYLYYDGMGGFINSIATNVVDTTGAGDALFAGIVYGIYNGYDIKKSVRYGLACAAVTVSSSLTVSPMLSPVYIEKIMAAGN
ncbi:carbohydrate kinase [Calorimonas adulescens]|jgi:Sugar-specific transcriptional regulator TrmB./pfkB family carbohydrate kinase.|uniref:Winged helix-turn-helix transcriptional regulator n=1 Tax=Calorimonas adulescens TaxID=2606906 RepID=A0A5D8Q890_9THEO|nr:carbohydrate kinase [Calorimonas adulescens]TZE80860.1 winged helix-turn-helix transcriptional regulator [Calorimonas adulescens]